MPKVMVMGKHAAILPFKAVGVEIRDIDDVQEAKDELARLAATEEETLILLPEELAAECQDEIAVVRTGTAVVVMTLPATSGDVGVQREHVRQMVARSIGVDLMGKKK